MNAAPAITFLCSCLAAHSAVTADELAGEPEVIVVEPAASDALEEPAFATVVRVDDRRGETATVAEVIAEGVGVRVRSLGGLGSYSSISVRGQSSGSTTILIDGVPLSRLGSASIDLGRFELATFSEVQVVRGGAPVLAGASALGGAVQLTTRIDPGGDDHQLSASFGVGSYGARHALARYLGRLGRYGLHVASSYRGAEGDFVYFSDNGTNLNPDDDSEERRTNNGFDQLDVVLRLGRLDRSFELGARTQLRSQGIPGFGSVQTESTSLDTASQLVDAARTWATGDGEGDLELRGFGLFELARYRDVDGEVGLGAQNRRYLTTAAGANLIGRRRWGRHRLMAAIEGRWDHYAERDLDSGDGRRTRGLRPGGGLSLSDHIDLDDGRWLVAPAIRVDVLHTRPAASSNAALPMAGGPRTDVFASPRLSARQRLSSWLSLKGNAGLYFRPPTLLEAFGDRGFVVGNPNLRSERGASMDLGLVASEPYARGPFERWFAELAVFGIRAADPIAFSSNAGGFTGATNFDDTTTLGAEASATARVARHLALSANYTLLWTRRDAASGAMGGLELPGRPRHQVFGRVDVDGSFAGRRLGAWSDLTATSSSYIDAANRDPLPRRLFVGAGVRAELTARVRLGVEAKNLFDARVEEVELSPAPSPELSRIRRAVADFFGYPLPGRALYATLEMTL